MYDDDDDDFYWPEPWFPQDQLRGVVIVGDESAQTYSRLEVSLFEMLLGGFFRARNLFRI